MAPRSSKSSKKPLSGTIFEDTYVATLENGEKHIVAIELSNESGCVYYDVLTDESINNVRSWLIEYFANQTNKMDQIIKKGKELKGETLD